MRRRRAGPVEPERAVIWRGQGRARADGISAGTLLTTQRRSAKDALLLNVAPLMASRSGVEDGLRGTMVIAIDPENRSVISTAGMEKLYGLTGAEMRVCRLLVEGCETQTIADMRNVTAETVRTQVKSILAKTRTSKRSDVVRLALTVNLPVDLPNAGSGH